MRDYAEAARAFDHAQVAAAALRGNLEALNACVECCDRHTGSDQPALIWEDRDGNGGRYTFDQLQVMAARFANVLKGQVEAGDRRRAYAAHARVAGDDPRHLALGRGLPTLVYRVWAQSHRAPP